tara:strand:- start:14084 stop:18739 length:4656 start_codon:yes stop_codon:yes gene_type:complete
MKLNLVTGTETESLNSTTNLPTPKKEKFSFTTEELKAPNSIGPRDINPYDSMNFTDIYTDPLSKYKEYGVPTTRFFNWDEQRAKNQGTGEKWIRGLSKALVTTVGAVAENTLGVLAGVGELAFGSGYYYDNFVGHSIDKANDWMREAMPNYKTEAETNMSTGQKLGTANFWADTVMNGVGYSLGSIATMWLTGGVGVAMRGANLMSKASKSKGLYDVSKAITTGAQLADKAHKLSRAQKLLKSGNMLEMGLYMSLAEASVEAREAQKTAYDDIVKLELEKRGLSSAGGLGEDTLKDILDASYSAGNADFLLQLPVLAGTNLLMFGRQLTGFKTAVKGNADVALNSATKAVIDKTAGKGLFRTGLAKLSPAGRGASVEAFQEGWQFASKVGAVGYHTDKYFNGGAADMTDSLYQGIQETLGTQEGLEAMLVGAIVGGGVSGVTSMVEKPYAQRKKNAQYLKSILDGGYLYNAANKGQTMNMMVVALSRMEKARLAGDHKAFKDAQNDLIMYNAFEAIQTGGFDVFMEKLDDSASLNDYEFAQAFGYDPKVSIVEQTKDMANPYVSQGKTKEQIVEGLKEKFKVFKETHDQVSAAYPPADRKTGLQRMKMTEEERTAEDAVYAEKEGLRSQLILGLYGIKDRGRRLQSIQKNMQALLSSTANLVNGVPMMNGSYSLNNMPEIEGDPVKYSAKEEQDKVRNRLDSILKQLQDENADPLVVAEFLKQGQDYLSILAQNQEAVQNYNRLSTDAYFQKVFNEERVKNEKEAKQRAKDEKIKQETKEAKTTEDLENVESKEEAKGEAKVDKDAKYRKLKQEEKDATEHYLISRLQTTIEGKIQSLKKIDTSTLTPIQLKGLTTAIEILEKQLEAEKNKTGERNPEVLDDVEDIKDEDAVIIKAEEPAPRKRKVADPAQLTIEDNIPVSTLESAPQLKVQRQNTNTDTVYDNNTYKIPVDSSLNARPGEPDTVNGIPVEITLNPILGESVGKEVEFVIIENDYFVKTFKGTPTEIENTPLYIKMGDKYIGKLTISTSKERSDIVEQLKNGLPVTTSISEIFASNYNNAVLDENTGIRAFFNVKDVFGNGTTKDVLLAFTVVDKDGFSQWAVSDISPEKNQKDLPKIKSDVQSIQTGKTDQIAIVARPENVPGGQAKLFLGSTANLSAPAQEAVIDSLLNRDFDRAQEIIASSMLTEEGNYNDKFLFFTPTEMVYFSTKLRKLVRIDEIELVKALKGGTASFNTVVKDGKTFAVSGKLTTEQFNIQEDFKSFIEAKKYHISRSLGNSVSPYTSPVNPQNTYDNYQEYLFSANEVGERMLGEGHYSILSTDAIKLGESLFNNPGVLFERPDAVNESSEEITKKLNIKDFKSKEAPVAPVDPRNPANWKTGDEILITINARRKAQYKVKITKIFGNTVEYTDPDSKKTVQIIVDENGIFEKSSDEKYGILRSARLVTTEAPVAQQTSEIEKRRLEEVKTLMQDTKPVSKVKTLIDLFNLPKGAIKASNFDTIQEAIDSGIKYLKDQINAKYDAELAALKPTQQTSEVVAPKGFKDKFNKKDC